MTAITFQVEFQFGVAPLLSRLLRQGGPSADVALRRSQGDGPTPDRRMDWTRLHLFPFSELHFFSPALGDGRPPDERGPGIGPPRALDTLVRSPERHASISCF